MKRLATFATVCLVSTMANAMDLELSSENTELMGCDSPKYIIAEENETDLQVNVVDASTSQKYQVTVYKNGKKDSFVIKKSSFSVELGEMPKELQRMNYTVMVQGLTNSADFVSKSFEVVRPMLLELNTTSAKSCMTQYDIQPFSGLITNNTSQNRTEVIAQKEVESTIKQKERSMSWLLRLTAFGLVDIGPSVGYMKTEALEKTQTSERSLSTVILPGETVMIGKRQTMIKVPYNVFKADACGNHELIGEATLSYLQVEYPAVTVNSGDKDPFSTLNSGLNASINTCSDSEGTGNEIIFDISNL